MNRLPRALDGVRVPSGLPDPPRIGLGHLARVIEVRDTWMHGIDLARATGKPRVAGGHDAPLIEQVLRDLSLGWSGPAVELKLTGAYEGPWLIGSGTPVAEVSADAIELCRLLAGRPAYAPVTQLAGDPDAAAMLTAARVLF